MLTGPIRQPMSDRGTAFMMELRPALLRYFRRKCGGTAEAEDLTQDVILRVLPSVDWTSADRARGYVFQAAANRWRDRCRRLQVRGTNVQWDDVTAAALDTGQTPEQSLLGEQELAEVNRALLQLNERTRDVLVLIRLEQMTQTEVAETLGISISAVNKHLAKALAHLAASCREGEVKSP